jgi:hypothetical protein
LSASNLEFWFDFANTYSYVSAARSIFKEQDWNDSPFNVYPA